MRRDRIATLVIFIIAILMMSGVLGYMAYEAFYFSGGVFILAPIFMFVVLAIMIVITIVQIINLKKGNTDTPGNKDYFTDSYTGEQGFIIKGQKKDANNQLNNDNFKCPMCGSEAESGQKFCDNCGYNLKN
jgi:hypothetical protein